MDPGLLSLKWNNHSSTFFHVLENIRKKELYSDVTLACDGKFFPVHKLVLSTCSDYFQAIFEKAQCKHPIIVLKDISHKDLESLLNYMYIGEVNVIQNELSSLIKAAECLRVKGLAVPDEPPPSKKTQKRLNVHEKEDSQVTPSKRNRKSNASNVPEEAKMDTTSNEAQDMGTEEQQSIVKELAQVNIKEEQAEPENPTEVKNENFEDEETAAGAVGGSDDPLDAFTGQNDDSNSQFPSTSGYEDQWSGDIETIDDDDDGDMSGFDQLDPSQFVDPTQANSQMKLHLNQSAEADCSASEVYFRREDNKWKCDYPGCKSFVTECKRKLRRHVRSHTGEKPFKCQWCEYATVEANALKIHVMRHTGEKPYKCQFCEYKTITSSHLKRHIKTHSSGRKPFECSLCDFSSVNETSLKTHWVTAHGVM